MKTPRFAQAELMPDEIPVEQEFILARLSSNDIDSLQEVIRSDDDIARYVTWVALMENEADLGAAVRRWESEPNHLRYGIFETHGLRLVGSVGMYDSKDKTRYEFSYFRDPRSGHRGVVTRSMSALIRVAEGVLESMPFGLNIQDENTESARVAQRLGFEATDEFVFDAVLGASERRWVREFGL